MTEDELQTRVISNIRALRKKAGLSQEKLADKADISRQMMNDIEGRRRWLTKKTLVKLANALEVDVYKLFLPSANENETTKGIYDYITKEVVLQIKDAVDKTLDNFLTTVSLRLQQIFLRSKARSCRSISNIIQS